MLQNYSKWQVLRPFFDDPMPQEGFTVRGISKDIGLAPPSVKLHLDELAKKKESGYPLVFRKAGRTRPLYWPNQSSDLFRFYKKMDMIFRIHKSGLLGHFERRLSPDAIILFGSASRGQDTKESDVDLFLLCPQKHIDLESYEHALKRKISLHFSEDFSSMPKELKNNIINGVILSGYLKVF